MTKSFTGAANNATAALSAALKALGFAPLPMTSGITPPVYTPCTWSGSPPPPFDVINFPNPLSSIQPACAAWKAAIYVAARAYDSAALPAWNAYQAKLIAIQNRLLANDARIRADARSARTGMRRTGRSQRR